MPILDKDVKKQIKSKKRLDNIVSNLLFFNGAEEGI